MSSSEENNSGGEEERTSSPSSEEKVAAKIKSNSEENDSEDDATKAMDELNIGGTTGEEGDKETASGGRKKGQKEKKEEVGDVTKETEEASGKTANKDTEQASGVRKKGKKKGDCGGEEERTSSPSSEEEISIWVKDERDGETTPVELQLPPGANIKQLIQEAKQNLEYLKYYDITCLYVMINGEKINTSSSISVAEIMNNPNPLGDKEHPFCIGVCITIDFLKKMFTTGKAHGGKVRNVYLIVKYKSNAMTDDQIRWYENKSGTHAEEFFLQDFKNGKFPVECRYDLYSNFTPCIDDGRCSYKLIDDESPTHFGCEVHIYALCRYWKQHYNNWDWITRMRAIRENNISIEVLSILIRDTLLMQLGSDLSYYEGLKGHLLSKEAIIKKQLQMTQRNLNKI